jgi:hypothetical protein
MKRRDKIQIVVLTLLFLLGGGQNAWALQSHPPPEGIYVHQMAHILFMGALAYLYWHTRRTPAIASKGWKYLQIFCILLFLWNLMAFSGHEFSKFVPAKDIIDKNSLYEQIAPPITLAKSVYYFTRMDHFLNVPALLALVISLRTFYREACEEDKQ